MSKDRQSIGRLLIDPPTEGALNMAIDAAILASAAPGDPFTLRFYRWCEPTLSLGYFQSIADRAKHDPSRTLPVVRRATGGGAIIHHHELTYSLMVPTHLDPGGIGSSPQWYRLVHLGVIAALASCSIRAHSFSDDPRPFGHKGTGEPFLCFQRRNGDDLIVSGYKVMGSAQRRGAGGLLQHGSLLLETSPYAPELPGLRELCEWPATKRDAQLKAETIQDAIAAELGHRLGVSWTTGACSDRERQHAQAETRIRFASSKWTQRR